MTLPPLSSTFHLRQHEIIEINLLKRQRFNREVPSPAGVRSGFSLSMGNKDIHRCFLLTRRRSLFLSFPLAAKV